jgi:hypothetical protein
MGKSALSALFLLILASFTSAAIACEFQPSTYSVLGTQDVNITVNVTYDHLPLTVRLSCGDQYDPHPSVSLAGEAQGSQVVLFTCNYHSSGNKFLSLSLLSGDFYSTPIQCANAGSVWVTYLKVDNVIAKESYLKTGTADIAADITNVFGQFTGYRTVSASLIDQTDNVPVGINRVILYAAQPNTTHFTWDVSRASLGYHLLNVTANRSTFSSSNWASSSVTVLVVQQPTKIAASNGSVTNTSAVIFWSSETYANSTIFYWNDMQNVYNRTNSSLAMQSSALLESLLPGTIYSCRVASCNIAGCSDSEVLHFTTLPSVSSVTPSPTNPAASASVEATVTATVTASPTGDATATPSDTTGPPSTVTPTSTNTGTPGNTAPGNEGGGSEETPSPSVTQRPTYTPTPTPTPIPKIYIENAQDETELNKYLEENKTSEIINSTDKERFNIINVVSYIFDPNVTIRTSKMKVIGTTDSKFPLVKPECYIPPSDRKMLSTGSAKCECVENYANKPNRFICTFPPIFKYPIASRYTLVLTNTQNESGIFIMNLPDGRLASLDRYLIENRRSDLYYYVAGFVGIMLAGYAIYHLFLKFERDDKAEDLLMMQKKKILDDMDTLKKHYLKRDLEMETFNHAMLQKQKELTEVNTRIAEFENKMVTNETGAKVLLKEEKKKTAAEIKEDIKKKDLEVEKNGEPSKENTGKGMGPEQRSEPSKESKGKEAQPEKKSEQP